ncbi:UDP-N-acetylmuramoyl-L-alanine--D-glutamate ligase [uncultured Duncaniella sp.]|uniref:UDP-N-acetylmuramoyl-L-alanine--D-glutamate ligase n=1 Tax=uncultured Duncaniella sp. TaxID=2768039 RepID=UPI0026476079|nr:UDP-N-acetylmuramoyl-L-alanine--D-glutamate ligase [uncultured Duncaniella sp.]
MNLVILGGGESGVGAAILGKTKGFDVFLSDFGTIPERYRIQLDEEGIEWEQGGHSMDRILAADEVVKSPGIPPTAPVVKAILAKGIPVISEIEFAGRYTDARMVCITGSNGKTTTTLLTYHILRDAGLNVGLAGNVGRSLALQVAREHHDVYVIELSSFQLENMYDFHANIAVILNITPDHLDRYDYEMQNYVNAKFRILNNLTPRDAFIYWQDDPVIRRQLERVATEAARYPFAERMEVSDGYESCAWVDDDDMLNVNTPDRKIRMPRAELSLNGLHNLYNSMAAALSASILDIADDDIRRGLSNFEGVEHRLEPAGTVNGVRYINDSKATNVNSTWYALESMPADTVLILGGKDKGNDYSEILPLVKEKVKAVVCMGKDNGKLLDFFTGQVPEIHDTHSIEEAVRTCARMANPGDTVLLSPCCASFDLFNSYEDRGRQFKEQVSRLSSENI